MSFGLDAAAWSEPCALVTLGIDGEIELRFPSYASRPLDNNSREDWRVINDLKAAFDAHMVEFALDSGCFLSFNNLRGAHKRGAIGAGDRLVLRTYAVESLSPLQSSTGVEGPIFPVQPFVRAVRDN